MTSSHDASITCHRAALSQDALKQHNDAAAVCMRRTELRGSKADRFQEADLENLAESAVNAENSQARYRALGQTHLDYLSHRTSRNVDSTLGFDVEPLMISHLGIEYTETGAEFQTRKALSSSTPIQRFAMLNLIEEPFPLHAKLVVANFDGGSPTIDSPEHRIRAVAAVIERLQPRTPTPTSMRHSGTSQLAPTQEEETSR